MAKCSRLGRKLIIRIWFKRCHRLWLEIPGQTRSMRMGRELEQDSLISSCLVSWCSYGSHLIMLQGSYVTLRRFTQKVLRTAFRGTALWLQGVLAKILNPLPKRKGIIGYFSYRLQGMVTRATPRTLWVNFRTWSSLESTKMLSSGLRLGSIWLLYCRSRGYQDYQRSVWLGSFPAIQHAYKTLFDNNK